MQLAHHIIRKSGAPAISTKEKGAKEKEHANDY